MKKLYACIILCAILLTVCPIASDGSKNITIYYGVSLNINGTAYEAKDAGGQAVPAFIYNGTTYVPIRAVSEALGADVEWKNDTKTADIWPQNSSHYIFAIDYNITALKKVLSGLSVADAVLSLASMIDTDVDGYDDMYHTACGIYNNYCDAISSAGMYTLEYNSYKNNYNEGECLYDAYNISDYLASETIPVLSSLISDIDNARDNYVIEGATRALVTSVEDIYTKALALDRDLADLKVKLFSCYNKISNMYYDNVPLSEWSNYNN